MIRAGGTLDASDRPACSLCFDSGQSSELTGFSLAAVSAHARSWSEFLELNSFKIPASADYADRVSVNATYYQANYLGIVLVHCVIACFFRPLFLLGLTIIIGAAVYLFSVRKTPLTLSGAKVLSKKEVLICQSAVYDSERARAL